MEVSVFRAMCAAQMSLHTNTDDSKDSDDGFDNPGTVEVEPGLHKPGTDTIARRSKL